MKLLRILLFIVCTLLLVACNNDSETGNGDSSTDNGNNTEQPDNNGDQEGGSDEEETDTNTESMEQVIEAAMKLSGDSTAYEGKMEVYERIEEGESVLNEQMIESLYAQNESTGSDETGYQLYNKKLTTTSGSDSIETQFYRQPEMVSYSYYGPDNFWHANDYSQVDESIEERLDYMSPYDVLQLYEEFKDGAEMMAFDDGTFTVTFFVDTEQAVAKGLEYQYLEPESFYYTSDYMFELSEFAVMLTFDESDEMLTGVFVEGQYKDKANESILLRIQGRQTFESYMLTDEIRPPDEAFTSSGLNKWDY